MSSDTQVLIWPPQMAEQHRAFVAELGDLQCHVTLHGPVDDILHDVADNVHNAGQLPHQTLGRRLLTQA